VAVVLETNLALVRGAPQIIFTATALQLPGVFSGKLDLNALANAADEIKISLKTKYTSIGAFIAAEENITFKQADKIARVTPTVEQYGYEVTVELLAASPSATATLAVLLLRTPAA